VSHGAILAWIAIARPCGCQQADRPAHHLNEVGLYTVKDGKIVEERFFS